MSNIYFIHLKKDIGRYEHFKHLYNEIGGIIWDGVYNVPMDSNMILLNRLASGESTYYAKQAKINMFKHFLEHCKSDHIIVFEDDIMWDKDFVSKFNKIKLSLRDPKLQNWKLIYFGVSSKIEKEVTPILKFDNFELGLLPESKNASYTGAYGFILHRDVINLVIEKAEQDHLKYKPFDITCLGTIQKMYNQNCYITIPQLIIADVTSSNIRNIRSQLVFNRVMSWNIDNYITPKGINMYVICDNNITKIEVFLVYFTSLVPTVKIHLLIKKSNSIHIKRFLESCNTINMSYNLIDSFNMNYIQNFINQNNNSNNEFIFIANNYLSINGFINENFFEGINDKLKGNIDGIVWNVINCPRCINNKVQYNSKQFMCIRSESFKNKKFDDLNLLLNDEVYFYSNYLCTEISNNNLHNMTKHDIISFLEDESFIPNNIQNIKRINICNTFNKWFHWHFYGNIFKLLCMEYDPLFNNNSITVEKKYSSKINSQEFNTLKYTKYTIKNGVEFIMDTKFLKNLLDVNNIVKLDTLYNLYGMQVPYWKLSIIFAD